MFDNFLQKLSLNTKIWAFYFVFGLFGGFGATAWIAMSVNHDHTTMVTVTKTVPRDVGQIANGQSYQEVKKHFSSQTYPLGEKTIGSTSYECYLWTKAMVAQNPSGWYVTFCTAQ